MEYQYVSKFSARDEIDNDIQRLKKKFVKLGVGKQSKSPHQQQNKDFKKNEYKKINNEIKYQQQSENYKNVLVDEKSNAYYSNNNKVFNKTNKNNEIAVDSYIKDSDHKSVRK